METVEHKDLLLQKITGFLTEIGIPWRQGIMDKVTFLPGVDIINGSIIYDPEMILSPGDLLHEAGHIAVLLKEDRDMVTSPDVSGDLQAAGAEMGAIAWSWAALKHLNIPPEVVFHPDGYRGGSDAIIENFNNKDYFGVCLLQWFGMTKEPKHNIPDDDIVYPKMRYWLRQ